MEDKNQGNPKEDPQNYNDKKNATKHKNPQLTVSYDMGWKRRTSGHIYYLIYGHTFIIRVHTDKVLPDIVVVKKFARCDSAARLNIEPEVHECLRN